MSVNDQQRRDKMASMLYDNAAGGSRILSFRTKAAAADDAHINSNKVSVGGPQ